MTDASKPLLLLEAVSKEQASVLHNLLELYAYDFSEIVPLDLKPNGRFDAFPPDRWWTQGHHPFFIRHDGNLCGFAIAKQGSRLTGATDVMDVAEFFVVRGARGQKVGTRAAHALFTMFPGPWEVRVKPINVAAIRFWNGAVATWLGRPVTSTLVSAEGAEWDVLRFEKARA